MDDFIDNLKNALEATGFEIVPQEEFEEWCKASDAYHESSEGRAKEMLEEMRLKYYLDKIAKYKFTEDMGEISGFGGDYEMACRVMLDSGLQWFDANPDADPKFRGMKGVFGLIDETNEDAEALSSAVTKHVDGCSGAMHHAVISACLWIHKNGWGAYQEVMSKQE